MYLKFADEGHLKSKHRVSNIINMATNKREKSSQVLLNNLSTAIKELQASGKITIIDESENRIKILQQQLDGANETVATQKAQLYEEQMKTKELDKKFRDFCYDWGAENKQLKLDIQKLKDGNNAVIKSKENALLERAERAENKFMKTKSDLEKQKISNNKLKANLEDSEHRVKELAANTGVAEVDYSTALTSFQEVETRLMDLCTRFFDAPSTACDSHASFSEPYQAQQTKALSSRLHGIGSFSHLVFAYPRALLAQSSIAHRLSEDIFTPTCLPSPTGRRTVGDALHTSTDLCPSQKAILRSFLVTVFKTEEDRLRADIIDTVVADISREVSALLQPQKLQDFEIELRSFLDLATNVWNSLRKHPKWVSATSDLTACPRCWRYSDKYTQGFQNQKSPSPTLVLFPQIICEGDDSPFYAGMIWSDETLKSSRAVDHRVPMPSTPSPETDSDISSGLKKSTITMGGRSQSDDGEQEHRSEVSIKGKSRQPTLRRTRPNTSDSPTPQKKSTTSTVVS